MQITGAVLTEINAAAPYAGSRPIVVEQLELAAPGPGELLVKIEAASICHSDLSVVNGNRPRPVPMLLGHEAAGLVLETGSGVSDIQVRDRVVLTFLPRCGDCAGCRSNGRQPCIPGSASNGAGELIGGGRRLSLRGAPVYHHLGVSGFATHAVVDQRSAVVVGKHVPADIAALMGCAVLTGGGAVLNAAELAAGDSVAVVGLGGVGLAAILTAVALGAGEVIAIDPVPAKRAIAMELGATRAIDPGELSGVRVDVAIEAAGAGSAVSTAIAITGPGGRTVLAGLTKPGVTVPMSPLDLVGGGRRIIGCYLGSSVPARDIPKFIELWEQGKLPVEKLISDRIGLDQINEAMDALAQATVLRQVVTPA